MRICLLTVAASLAALAADAVPPLPVQPAAGKATKASVKNPTSVVRVSPQGRLVRTVVTPPGTARPKAVSGGVAFTTDGEFDLMIEQISNEVGVDPLLVHAVIRVESNYNQFALSEKGAQGYMQLIPETARDMGVNHAFSARENLTGGIKYIKAMLDQFGDLRMALAAYNAGPEAVEKYKGIPPYKETQDYVYLVSSHYNRMWRDKRAAMAAAAQTAPAPAAVAETEPEHKPLTAYTDAEGRLHMATE